jgi:hypothetical protein
LTDQAWAQGMAELVTCLPDREQTAEMQTVRGNAYRAELKHLSDEQWWYAVRASVRGLNWFPTVRQLLDYAEDCPPSETPRALLLGGKCVKCEGIGYVILESGPNTYAQRCECRPKVTA